MIENCRFDPTHPPSLPITTPSVTVRFAGLYLSKLFFIYIKYQYILRFVDLYNPKLFFIYIRYQYILRFVDEFAIETPRECNYIVYCPTPKEREHLTLSNAVASQGPLHEIFILYHFKHTVVSSMPTPPPPPPLSLSLSL